MLDPADPELGIPAEYAGMLAYTYGHYRRYLWGNLDRVVPWDELLE